MSNLTKTEIEVIKHYNPKESPEENAKRISKETGINLRTCRSYITALKKGLNFNDYYYGEEDNFLHPTEPREIIEEHDKQKGYDSRKRLSELEQEEIQEGVQKILEGLAQEQREIVVAHFYHDETYETIGKQKGVKRQAINSRMRRILKKLRSHAKKNGLKDYAPNKK